MSDAMTKISRKQWPRLDDGGTPPAIPILVRQPQQGFGTHLAYCASASAKEQASDCCSVMHRSLSVSRGAPSVFEARTHNIKMKHMNRETNTWNENAYEDKIYTHTIHIY